MARSFLDKLRNAPDAEAIKAKADAAAQKYESTNGVSLPPEQGAEEGDISDYVMPFKGLVKGIAKAGVKAGAKALAKEALKDGAQVAKKEITKDVINYAKNSATKPQQQPAVPGPDYKNENIAFRPTTPPKQEGWENFGLRKKINPSN